MSRFQLYGRSGPLGLILIVAVLAFMAFLAITIVAKQHQVADERAAYEEEQELQSRHMAESAVDGDRNVIEVRVVK